MLDEEGGIAHWSFIAVAFCTLLLTESAVTFSLFVLRNRNLMHKRGFAIEAMDALDPTTFKKMFRIDRKIFHVILEKILPFVKATNAVKAFNSSSGPMSIL